MAIRLTGLNSGMDTESMITELVSAKKLHVTSLQKAQTKLSWKNDAWKALNTKIYNLYSKTMSNMRFDSAYAKKKTTVSDPSIVSVTAGANAPNGVQNLSVESMAKAGYLTGGKLADGTTSASKLTDLGIRVGKSIDFTVGGETKSLQVDENTTISDLNSALKDAGLNANYDEGQQRIFISAKDTGNANDFEISGSGNVLAKLGLEEESGAIKIDGSNAVMYLNNVKYESSSNVFVINGTTYTAQGVSAKNEDGTLKETTITTADDYDGIYDTIKDFLSEYNVLMNEMAKLYNADSASKYEPLTAEEKEALSDSEVEDWETKIKDSLLRKDSTLGNVLSTMNSVMMAGVEVDGKTMHLSDFGIKTLGYFNADADERYALHIDGDTDDSSTSTNEDRFKTMITSDPEVVKDFFSKLANNLYSSVTSMMDSTDFSSMYKVFNDKQITSELDGYKTKISDAEKALTAYEDKWYAKFSAMETALARLSSKQDAVSSLFSV